jgi:H+-translocating NAD(P) transhydrogenase subunit beta
VASATELSYIAAAVLFIYGLKMLSRQQTARRGNLISALGMLIAVVATLFIGGMRFEWILVGLLIGSLVGIYAARTVEMTAMPELVALFNGFGGLASLLVGWAEYHAEPATATFRAGAIVLAVLVGGIAFSGSMVAYAKLAGRIGGRPILFKGQNLANAALLALILGSGLFLVVNPDTYLLFVVLLLLALLLGVLAVIPIGGADMPIVISLLNSYSGIAASAAGFIILNNVLIVAGALVGASGLILTSIMCKAMNRSLANVLFAGFGASGGKQQAITQGQVQPITSEDACYLLEAARSVVFVPGYGMAVAQAQHAVRELAELLDENGCEVRYAIHPVAGRMPGHMNVLLAEANVPYEQLVEPDDVNPIMAGVDVAVVIGANDVVNPAAREDSSSPLYGMPIIDVDGARTVLVLKRSMATGFSGAENLLFFKPNTRMLFGDAKASLTALIAAFKEVAA